MQTCIVGDQDTEILGVASTEMEDCENDMMTQKRNKDSTCTVQILKERPEVVVVNCPAEILPEQAFSFTQEVSYSV